MQSNASHHPNSFYLGDLKEDSHGPCLWREYHASGEIKPSKNGTRRVTKSPSGNIGLERKKMSYACSLLYKIRVKVNQGVSVYTAGPVRLERVCFSRKESACPHVSGLSSWWSWYGSWGRGPSTGIRMHFFWQVRCFRRSPFALLCISVPSPSGVLPVTPKLDGTIWKLNTEGSRIERRTVWNVFLYLHFTG